MDASAHFRGKKITLMGLGLLGRGVGDAQYVAECGAELIVTDLKTREELAPSLDALKNFPNITFILGEHRKEDFRGRDLILKAAGVPIDSPYIAEAEKEGTPVRMSADLFVEISGVECVGITGTRGKTTTTHMIYEILKRAYELGLNRSKGAVGRTGVHRKPVLGGNVRGVSTLALLKDATSDHIAVLELDSWQLQGFGETKMSPHIAVFTTFFQDHQNYYSQASERITKTGLDNSERAQDESFAYKDGQAQYLADKANIFLYQSEEDTLVLGKQCAPTIIEKYGERIEAKVIVADELKLPDTWALCTPGTHNRYNAALALSVARALGVDDAISRKALTSFSGVPGRLECVREVRGVKIYNDTTATTPEATLAALAALSDVGRTTSHIILIMGGTDKGLDMNALLLEIQKCTKRVILLAGTGTSRIVEWLPEASVYDSLEMAVAEAFRVAGSGDTILFSPAFASFGMFKNEYDRGDQFNALVRAV